MIYTHICFKCLKKFNACLLFLIKVATTKQVSNVTHIKAGNKTTGNKHTLNGTSWIYFTPVSVFSSSQAETFV